MFIEIQGIQHYKQVKFFHKDAASFLDAARRDRKKKQIADLLGYTILYIDTDTNFEELLFKEIQLADLKTTTEEYENVTIFNKSSPVICIAKDKKKYPLKVKVFSCPVCHLELHFEGTNDTSVATCCGITFNKRRYKKEKYQIIYTE